MSITFTGIGQVLAAVPHLLGFYPTDDVIIVKLHDDQIGELLRRHPLACVPLPPPDTENADKVMVIAYGSDEHSFTSASAVTMMTAQQFADHGITANPLGVFDDQWTRLKGLGEATIWSPVPMVDPGIRETLEQADGRIRERRAILAPALATTDDHSLAAVAICMAAHTQGDAVSRAHGVLQQVGGLEGVSVTDIAALIIASQVDAFITEAESAIYRRPEANLILWTIVATHAAGPQLTSPVLLTAYAAKCSKDVDLCHQALSLVKPSQLTPAAFELLDLMYGRH